ncbi:plasmid stabilization protein [Acidisoma cellulosilytica]|uniref:Plasmid stabilization protein n=1 Tax=Acidisoma cellulosilyticum TaxID=2802395 RepID=A0A964E2W5_9PROT|nr:plasmid stabilization protein [Acidisoma cellulosilyticum]MCB8879647.1 plasmid stabilization protein [Acidisoma cellulosilyticum]
MATLVIRNVDDDIHRRLKEQAASHGHSMEEEVRAILVEELGVPAEAKEGDWVDSIRAIFEPLGWLDLPEMRQDRSN